MRKLLTWLSAPLVILASFAFTSDIFSASNTVIIYALYYDTYLSYEPEETVALMNISGSPVSLDGWQITDAVSSGEGTVTFPSGSTIDPGQIIWVTKTATSFESEFGFTADYEYDTDSDPAVPNLTGTSPAFSNTGDECILKNDSGTVVDSIVYEGGNTSAPGWSGSAIYPYNNGSFGLEGQILYRKLDEVTCLPIADTDTEADWAQSTGDNVDGKKVRYPGWDLEYFCDTLKATESCHLEYLVVPDNVFERYLYYINQATTSIYIEGYTFNSYQLEQALVSKLQSGVEVKILLEGEPVGGIGDQEKWVAQQIENNGGEVYWMYNDSATDVHDRYDYQHSKFTIVDGVWLMTGSENLNSSSMAADDKTNGTEGNRGTYIITNATDVIGRALDIFDMDLDPANHNDLHRYNAAEDGPPSGFTPDDGGDPTTYKVQFWNPLYLDGSFDFEVVHSPENVLRESDSLRGMVNRAGAGGKVYVEQLYEYTWWGSTSSNSVDDPNLRLEAYIDAARRGAEVRILLDSVYADPSAVRGNYATADYVNDIAANESLDLACIVGSPTQTGIHNKMILIWDGSEGWTHTGSINGSENSNKNNRELALQIRSSSGFKYLADVFNYDWTSQGGSPIESDPPGEPEALMVTRNGNDIVVSWNDVPAGCNSHSCSVYLGDAATFASGSYSHNTSIVCNIASGSASIASDDTRLSTVTYFVAVANNAVREGSYGRDSAGTERPVSTAKCKDLQDSAICP